MPPSRPRPREPSQLTAAAFSLQAKEVSFLKGEDPGHRRSIPRSFREKRSARVTRLDHFAAHGDPSLARVQEKVGISALSLKPRSWHRAWEAPLPPQPDAAPDRGVSNCAFRNRCIRIRAGPAGRGVRARGSTGASPRDLKQGTGGADAVLPQGGAEGPQRTLFGRPARARTARSLRDAQSRNSLKFASPGRSLWKVVAPPRSDSLGPRGRAS